jgi:hypothetical protein
MHVASGWVVQTWYNVHYGARDSGCTYCWLWSLTGGSGDGMSQLTAGSLILEYLKVCWQQQHFAWSVQAALLPCACLMYSSSLLAAMCAQKP